MRLLCVYQHAPTPGAPGIYRHRLLLGELARRGWHVDLVSSPINYMEGSAPARYRGRPYVREQVDGVHHHWVWATGGLHRSFRWRALNYATFAASALVRGATLPRPDVVWASSPPLSVATVGELLALRFARPWLFEVRDLWPESAAAAGLLDEAGAAFRAVDRLARRYASRADAVLAPTPGLVDLVRGHGAREVELVTGAVVDSAAGDQERARERAALGVPDDAVVFAYVGAHGVVNGLDLVLDAAERLVRGPHGAQARFVFAGAGSDLASLRQRLRERPIPGVQLLGAVPRERVGSLLAASDVSLHVLRPDPLFESALPTKVLDSFGAHRPFVTTVPGLPRTLALDSGGGFAADADALADEFARWTQMDGAERAARGEQAFAYGSEHYGVGAAVDRLEAVLLATARARRRGIRGRAER